MQVHHCAHACTDTHTHTHTRAHTHIFVQATPEEDALEPLGSKSGSDGARSELNIGGAADGTDVKGEAAASQKANVHLGDVSSGGGSGPRGLPRLPGASNGGGLEGLFGASPGVCSGVFWGCI